MILRTTFSFQYPFVDFIFYNPLGYFQAGDALAIMPLEVFSQCIGICRLSNTIAKLLADPIKRYTPLRDLPPRLKSKLFRGKSAANYNGHFTESLILLTHMGLLQVTSEKLPSQRAHIVMYVCKEAKLVDTTLSEKGYSKVSGAYAFIFCYHAYQRYICDRK